MMAGHHRGIRWWRRGRGMKARGLLSLISAVLAPLMLTACHGGDSTAPNTLLVWSSVPSGTTEILFGIWGTSTSDVWAVGNNGTILHYNGTSWSSVSSGTSEFLFGIWGTSTSDVWAVGDNGTILHYNGASWSSIGSATTDHLAGVWGAGASSVWAVGGYRTINHGT